jgi:hypothetical protein
VHAAVDNSVSLVMVRSNLYLGDHLIGGGMNKVNAHSFIPASAHGVERGSKVAVGRGRESGSIRHSAQF